MSLFSNVVKTSDVTGVVTAALGNLKANWKSLPEKDHSFATSLLVQAKAKGGLSAKQWVWVEKLSNKINNPAGVVETKVEPTSGPGPYLAVHEMFEHASQHLKYPKVFFVHPETKIKWQLRVGTWKGKKAVHVKAGPLYLGSVDYQGYFRLSKHGHSLDDHVMAAEAALYEIAKDPANFLGAVGTAMGQCCFCKKPLTDDPSLQAGYGPVCAKHYNLPWGGKAAAPKTIKKEKDNDWLDAMIVDAHAEVKAALS